jgi:predicted YcjX-like family ATPase
MSSLHFKVSSLSSRVGSLVDKINNLQNINYGLSETEVRDIAEEYYNKLKLQIGKNDRFYKREINRLDEKINEIECNLNKRISNLEWENSVRNRYNFVKNNVPQLQYEDFYQVLYREEIIVDCFSPLKIDFLIEYFTFRYKYKTY